MGNPNPFDYFALRNLLSQYCVLIDNRQFNKLDQIFAVDAVVVFPFATRKGSSQVARLIEQR
jgi:hypothetical protein